MSVIARSGAVLALCAALAGCGNATADPEHGPAPRPASPSPIDYAKTGGIAGVSERLHIGRTGRAMVSEQTGVDSAASRFQVGAKRLSSLRAALAKSGFAGIGAPQPTGCADCFIYTVAWRGHSVTRDESDVPSRLAPVLRQLGAIVDAHLH